MNTFKTTFVAFLLLSLFFWSSNDVNSLSDSSGKRSRSSISHKGDHKERAWLLMRMSRILFAAKTDLDGITHEQTITCRQLFPGHMVGSQPMKMGEKIHRMIIINIIHQTHYENYDWSRAFNKFTLTCELDMINAISAADIAFIMSSSTSAWLLSPLECSPQKQNSRMLRFCFWGWICIYVLNYSFNSFNSLLNSFISIF